MAANKKKKPARTDKKLFNIALKGKAGWIVALVFLSAWMFFLGILVGRGTVPVVFKSDELQQELAQLKEADTKALHDKVQINTDTQKTKKDLEFYEKLKQSKKPPPRHKQPTPKASTAAKKPAVEKPKPKTAQKAKPKQPKPAARPSQPPKTSQTKAAGPKNLAIQVASFRTAGEADKMVNILKSKGYKAFKETGIVEGRGVWHRVRIGYYADRSTANWVLKKLKTDGHSGFVIKK